MVTSANASCCLNGLRASNKTVSRPFRSCIGLWPAAISFVGFLQDVIGQRTRNSGGAIARHIIHFEAACFKSVLHRLFGPGFHRLRQRVLRPLLP